MPSQTDWVGSLSPWPEEFGLGRMRALLGELGTPQRSYPAIHVVGTNGKSTTVRRIESLLSGEGLAVGAYLSPHVSGWAERIRLFGEEADFEASIARVRPAAERLGATQFEAVTAAALAAFAAAGVEVAVVEAGLGGRLDATNVLATRVVVLTNVALDHTDVLGETREQIAAEKLAVIQPGASAVLGESEWAPLAHQLGANPVAVAADVAHAAAEEFLGRTLGTDPEDLQLPGRFDIRGESPLELWDGAHNPAGARWLVERLPRDDWTLVVSIMRDKDAAAMLAALSAGCSSIVVTEASNPRALPAAELAERARPYFPETVVVSDPVEALDQARATAGSDGAVLVTGSLYLLEELHSRLENIRWRSLASG